MEKATISWIRPDGTGAIKHQGRVFAFERTIPGDEVEFNANEPVDRQRLVKHFHQTAPSPHRIQPVCTYSSTCSGCDLDFFSPDARLNELAKMVQFSLRQERPPTILASPKQIHHRARVRVATTGSGFGLRKSKSHEVTPLPFCLTAHELVNEGLAALNLWATSQGLSTGEVELRTDGTKLVANVLAGGDRGLSDYFDHIAVRGRRRHGDPTLHLTTLGHALRCSANSFYQVNLQANELLAQWIIDRAAEISPERIIDLYSGIGNLTLPLSDLAPVLAIENSGQASDDCEHNATGRPIRTLRLDANRFDPSLEAFDCAVLDPPRAGAGKVLSRVLTNRPRRVVVISCDVRSATSDAKIALKAGYKLSSYAIVDMFVSTHHVETIAVYDR